MAIPKKIQALDDLFDLANKKLPGNARHPKVYLENIRRTMNVYNNGLENPINFDMDDIVKAADRWQYKNRNTNTPYAVMSMSDVPEKPFNHNIGDNFANERGEVYVYEKTYMDEYDQTVHQFRSPTGTVEKITGDNFDNTLSKIDKMYDLNKLKAYHDDMYELYTHKQIYDSMNINQRDTYFEENIRPLLERIENSKSSGNLGEGVGKDKRGQKTVEWARTTNEEVMQRSTSNNNTNNTQETFGDTPKETINNTAEETKRKVYRSKDPNTSVRDKAKMNAKITENGVEFFDESGSISYRGSYDSSGKLNTLKATVSNGNMSYGYNLMDKQARIAFFGMFDESNYDQIPEMLKRFDDVKKTPSYNTTLNSADDPESYGWDWDDFDIPDSPIDYDDIDSETRAKYEQQQQQEQQDNSNAKDTSNDQQSNSNSYADEIEKKLKEIDSWSDDYIMGLSEEDIINYSDNGEVFEKLYNRWQKFNEIDISANNANTNTDNKQTKQNKQKTKNVFDDYADWQKANDALDYTNPDNYYYTGNFKFDTNPKTGIPDIDQMKRHTKNLEEIGYDAPNIIDMDKDGNFIWGDTRQVRPNLDVPNRMPGKTGINKYLDDFKNMGFMEKVMTLGNVAGAVSDYKNARREGHGVVSSAIRAGTEFALGEALGMYYPLYLLAKEAPGLVIKGTEMLYKENRKMNSAANQQVFGGAQFQDTQQLATMRQSGMEMAKMAQYNLQQSLMGQEASFLHR